MEGVWPCEPRNLRPGDKCVRRHQGRTWILEILAVGGFPAGSPAYPEHWYEVQWPDGSVTEILERHVFPLETSGALFLV